MLCKISHEFEYGNYTDDTEFCCDKDENTGKCIGLPDYFSNENYGIVTELSFTIMSFILYAVRSITHWYRSGDKTLFIYEKIFIIFRF